MDEDDETLSVSGTTAATGLTVTPATVTITDNDTRGVTVTPTDLPVAEDATGTYTVVLASEPTDAVTVTPTVSGSSDVTLDVASLTFTTANWDQAQTVTVSAADDTDAVDDTAAVAHAVSGGDYASVTADTVTVTVNDNEEAATAVALTVSPAAVAEDADVTTVTVTGTLDGAARTEATSVTVSVGAADDAATDGTDYTTVADFTLTIDAGETSDTASFTLTPTDDDVDEDDESLSVSGTTAATGLTVTPATITITDNDTRGVTVTPTAVTVAEDATGTYTVVLASEPTDAVTVTPTVSGSSDVTVDAASLTFTTENWATAQTVTVSAADDADAENDSAAVAHAVSGGDYATATADTVTVTVNDDEEAATGLALAVSPAVVAEDAGGTTMTVTATLEGSPLASDTTVTVSIGAAGDGATEGADYATVADLTLTITAGDTSGTATFTLTPTDDDVDEDDETLTVGGSVTGLTVTPATVTIEDNDTRAVVVTPTDLTVAEEGTGTYTVVLESEPTGSVTVTPTVSGSSDVTVSPANLEFTTSDWATAQSVTVTAADDADAEDDTATVAHAVSGGDYASTTADTVTVTVTDNEDASTGLALTVSPAVVAEDAGDTTVTVTATLEGSPLASDTSVTVSIGAAADGAAAGTDYTAVADFTLTITAGDTSGTATFTLTPTDDGVDEEDETLTVGGSVTGLTVTPTTVTIEDNDTRAVVVTPTDLTVAEDGTGTYTVVLQSEPTATVTVTPTVSGSPDVTVSPASLGFTTSDWATPQTVTVTAADDTDAEDDTATVAHAVSGGDYAPVTADTVTVTVNDNEDASTGLALTVSPAVVTEDAGGTTMTVIGTLDGSPRTSATSVTVSVGAAGDGATEGTDYATVADLTLTIPAGETSDTATFTLTPTDDGVDEEDETLTVGGSATGLTVTPATVTIEDNDTRAVLVTPVSLTVPEDGTGIYTVVLRSEPTAPVTVAPTVSGSSDVTVSPTRLRFTTSNWNQAQLVTVSAADDADAKDDTAAVAHPVLGGDYASVIANTVTVTVNDDEVASTEVALTVSLAAVTEDAEATPVTVTGKLDGAPQEEATSITVSVGAAGDDATEGSDYATVADFTLTIAAGDTTGTATFTLTPADDDVDEEDEALTVDGSVASDLTVTPATMTIEDNDERGVKVDQTHVTVPASGTATYGVVLKSEPTATVTVTPSVVDNPNVTVSPPTLTFTIPNWNQEQTVTLTSDADAPQKVSVVHTVSGGDYDSAPTDTVKTNDGGGASTAVALTVSPAAVDEAAGATAVTVTGTLNGARRTAATAVTVTVGAAGDAAAEGTDYATVNDLTLIIAAGQTSGTATFTLTPADDDIDETDETLTVAGTTTAAGLSVSGATVTIIDDDRTNHAPEFNDGASTTRTFDETLGGAAVQTDAAIGAPVTASDADGGDRLTYGLGGTDAAMFALDASSGQVRTRTGTSYDYETDNSYELMVTVVDGNGGADTTVVTLNLANQDEPPVAPAAPVVTAGGTTSLDVGWTPPDNTGRPAISSYDVQYRVATDGTWTDGPQDVDGTSARITGLTRSWAYEVRVRASNGDGDGEWSPAGRGSTAGNRAPSFAEGSGTTRELSSETPADATETAARDIGAPVEATDVDGDPLTYNLEGVDATHFTIVSSSGQIRTKVGESYDHEERPSYAVTVKTEDGNGGSALIEVVIEVKDAPETPQAPAAPTVEATSGATTSLEVSWTPPDNSGRPAITSYGLRYRTATESTWMDGPQDITGTSAQITGLSEDTPYLVQVQAANADGAGVWSDSGEARTGKAAVADPDLSRAFLARFGRMAAVEVVDQVDERIRARRAAGARTVVAGRNVRSGMERDIGSDFLGRLRASASAGRLGSNAESGTSVSDLLRIGLGAEDLLASSSFEMNQEAPSGGVLSLWSRGARSQFEGQENQISLDGRGTTLMAGADYAGRSLLGGLMLSHNRGQGDYAGDHHGDMVTSMTSLHPWLGLKAGNRVTLWATTGYGTGGLSLTPREGMTMESGPAMASHLGTTLESGLVMAMGAGGVRGDLVGAGASGFGLAFKADALWVNTDMEGVQGPAGRLEATDATVTRLRAALEVSQGFDFNGGLLVRPRLELGMRQDGGDAETGNGVDIAGSLAASNPGTGLSLNVHARTLLVHEAEGLQERGVALSLSYDPSPSSPLGVAARISPSWGGQATSQANSMWNHETVAGLSAVTPAGGRVDAEFSYALPVGNALVGTPRLGFRASDMERDYRLGYTLSLLQRSALDFRFGIDAQRREIPGQTGAEHNVLGRISGSWKMAGARR